MKSFHFFFLSILWQSKTLSTMSKYVAGLGTEEPDRFIFTEIKTIRKGVRTEGMEEEGDILN